MKFLIPDALVTAVTGHAEKNGEEAIHGGKSLTIEASVDPKVLKELDEQLPEMFYNENDIPRVEGLGVVQWMKEYEKAVFQVGLAAAERDGDLTFTAADVKKISFFVKPGFLVNLKFTVKVNANKPQHGELDYLLQQKCHVTIKKAHQVRIPDGKPKAKEGDDKQQSLPGTEAGQEDSSKHTTDGQAIVPLVHYGHGQLRQRPRSRALRAHPLRHADLGRARSRGNHEPGPQRRQARAPQGRERQAMNVTEQVQGDSSWPECWCFYPRQSANSANTNVVVGSRMEKSDKSPALIYKCPCGSTITRPEPGLENEAVAAWVAEHRHHLPS